MVSAYEFPASYALVDTLVYGDVDWMREADEKLVEFGV
jgi:hypothetical protein